MREAASGQGAVSVRAVPARYPMGSEKQLILALTGHARESDEAFAALDAADTLDADVLRNRAFARVCRGDVDGAALDAAAALAAEPAITRAWLDDDVLLAGLRARLAG